MLYVLRRLNRLKGKALLSLQSFILLVSMTSAAYSATLQCSASKGEATLNEVYAASKNDNFIEVKIFDPAYTSYTGWSIVYCENGDSLNQCTTSVADVATMTQNNVYWFTQDNVAGLQNLNKNKDFVLLLLDSSDQVIDMLSVNNAALSDMVNCSFYYDTTVSTASNPKAIVRDPDGTGDWDDAPGQGNSTVTTPGNSNDGVASAQIIADYRMDECYWDGTVGEVIDSSTPSYNGTSKGDANTTVNAGGGVCYNGNFLSNYVQLPTFPHINGSRTITAWFNTKDIASGAHQRIFADDENNNNGSYALSVGDPGAGRVRFYIRGLSTISLDSASVVANDTWYFAAATFNKAAMKKTLYIYDAAGTLLNEVSQTVTGTVGTPTGNASLGGETINGETSNRFNGFLDEVKVFDGVLYRTDIENILNNERAGKNYDGTDRICGCAPGVTPKDGNYNAVDFIGTGCNAQTHWSDTIKTKIVNDSINLSILAKDRATDLPLEANITKITLVHYPAGDNTACSGTSLASVDVCTNCGLTDVDGCLSTSISKTFNARASKCVEVLIEGKDKDDTTGVSLSESNASDNFAIRPETYSCDGIAPSVLVAERSYASDFTATPLNLTSATPGYTTSSVLLTADKYMRTGDLNSSLGGVVSPASISFTEGNASSIDLRFSDVGDIGIDLNDSTWANVDSDDTSEAERVVFAQCRRLFRPDHFKVELTRPLLENNATGFTYLSNLAVDVNMSAWVRNLSMRITAEGESNGTTVNYADPGASFYANDITLLPVLSLPLKHSNAIKRIDLTDENSSTIVNFSFVNGVAIYSYDDVAFNYHRSYSDPIIPFVVDGNETYFTVDVYDRLYTSVIGSDSTDSDGNVTFYYGRLRTDDIVTTLSPISNPVLFEVYDNLHTPYTAGMKQTSLFWFINDRHTGDEPGHIIEATASSNTIIDNVLGGFTFTYTPVSAGTEAFGITSSINKKAVIHLKTQEWLWYVPSGFGSAYDDTAGSDCTMHPCFDYTMTSSNGGLMIQSGDFNGTLIPDQNRSDYQRKGVKLFR